MVYQFFFYITLQAKSMMAIGSMNKIKNPIAPKREPPLVILTNRGKAYTGFAFH